MTDVIIEEEIRIERERRERARVRVKMEGRRERVRGEERGRKRRGGGEKERERIDMCIQIESHVKVSEGAMYKSRREASKCNQSCQHLDLGLLASRAMRK